MKVIISVIVNIFLIVLAHFINKTLLDVNIDLTSVIFFITGILVTFIDFLIMFVTISITIK